MLPQPHYSAKPMHANSGAWQQNRNPAWAALQVGWCWIQLWRQHILSGLPLL